MTPKQAGTWTVFWLLVALVTLTAFVSALPVVRELFMRWDTYVSCIINPDTYINKTRCVKGAT